MPYRHALVQYPWRELTHILDSFCASMLGAVCLNLRGCHCCNALHVCSILGGSKGMHEPGPSHIQGSCHALHSPVLCQQGKPARLVALHCPAHALWSVQSEISGCIYLLSENPSEEQAQNMCLQMTNSITFCAGFTLDIIKREISQVQSLT